MGRGNPRHIPTAEEGRYGLRNALLDTDEKRFAFLHNAAFHAVIESLCLTLPGLVESYAKLGIASDVELARRVDEAMRRPVPLLSTEEAPR